MKLNTLIFKICGLLSLPIPFFFLFMLFGGYTWGHLSTHFYFFSFTLLLLTASGLIFRAGIAHTKQLRRTYFLSLIGSLIYLIPSALVTWYGAMEGSLPPSTWGQYLWNGAIILTLLVSSTTACTSIYSLSTIKFPETSKTVTRKTASVV